MPHAAKILLDSITERGYRLTSFECKFPRIILAEWNTHRVFSRSSASSRAIPVAKMLKMVMEDPYVPTSWGKNQKGMSAVEDILGEEAVLCEKSWLYARDSAVKRTEELMEIGVHKQTANRLLEPFMWHTIINTATEYSNFYGLRDDKNAHPDIQIIAGLMRIEHYASEPDLLKEGQWHAPYAPEGEELLDSVARQITAARCARLSYKTQDGAHDQEADLGLHDRLLSTGHMGPFEHTARPMSDDEFNIFFKQPFMVWNAGEKRFFYKRDPETGDKLFTHFCGNLQGWVQYRKELPNEEDYGTYLKNKVQVIDG